MLEEIKFYFSTIWPLVKMPMIGTAIISVASLLWKLVLLIPEKDLRYDSETIETVVFTQRPWYGRFKTKPNKKHGRNL